ncbi:MAG: ribosome recycling factor [Puniceicoccales bacterium]|jgi:ribosome recycling factor|nr:ribosome recycling factor [Puniceicoccales bacterium]
MDTKSVISNGTASMKKTVEHTLHEFTGLNTGKAQPSMVENVTVEVYGSQMRLKDIATISTPDARSIVIQPFDKNASKDIVQGIQAANLGFNPVPQGTIIRCPVPELTGERRADLVKVAHRLAEEGRVRVRNIRRDTLEVLKKGQKEVSEDELKRAEKEVQTATDRWIIEIDKALKTKETDLTKI